jgi:hypothetical protein
MGFTELPSPKVRSTCKRVLISSVSTTCHRIYQTRKSKPTFCGSIGGFGYLWSTTLNGDFIPFVDLGDDAFGIEGSHGHYLMVAPALNLVVVHRCADNSGRHDVTQAEFVVCLNWFYPREPTYRPPPKCPVPVTPRFSAYLQNRELRQRIVLLPGSPGRESSVGNPMRTKRGRANHLFADDRVSADD